MTVNAKHRAQDEFVREWRDKEVIGKGPCWELNLNDIRFYEESNSDDLYSDWSDQSYGPAAIDERQDENGEDEAEEGEGEEDEDEQYEYQEDEDDIMEDLDPLSGSDDGENNEPSGTYYDEGNERNLRNRLQELNIRAQEATAEAAPSQNVSFNSGMEWEGMEVDEYIPPWAGHL
ncbi:hypothetical protein V8F06_011322 [Rhypophila decipiens]